MTRSSSMLRRLALRPPAPRPRSRVSGSGSVPFSMPLGRSLGRSFTPLRVATSARSSAIACRKAAFSASSCSARASSSPRGRPERLIFFGADMPSTGRVQAGPAQPRQLTSARPFAPRTDNRADRLADGTEHMYSVPMQLHDAQGKRLYLTADERRRFIAAAARAERPVRTFCAVLHDSGCRISEALALTPERIDLTGQAIVLETLKK